MRDVGGGLAWTKRRVARRDEPAVHRNEMRRERQLERLAEKHGGFLRYLGGVAVLRNAVWADALVDRAEEERVLDSMTRAAHAGLRVDDDVLGHEARLERGDQREQRRGRIAAGVGDEARGPHAIARQLGEAVDGFLQELGRGVGVAVPAFVELRVSQTEVASDVDDGATIIEPRARLLRGLARRQGCEDDLGV